MTVDVAHKGILVTGPKRRYALPAPQPVAAAEPPGPAPHRPGDHHHRRPPAAPTQPTSQPDVAVDPVGTPTLRGG